MKIAAPLLGIVLTFVICSCGGWKKPQQKTTELPDIFPDYIGITIPKNIAPINFSIEGAKRIQVVLTVSDRAIQVSGGDFIDMT